MRNKPLTNNNNINRVASAAGESVSVGSGVTTCIPANIRDDGGEILVGSKYVDGKHIAEVIKVEAGFIYYVVADHEIEVAVSEFKRLAFNTMLRPGAKFIPPKKKRMTNTERLKRQGKIFNHSGECGKIVTK